MSLWICVLTIPPNYIDGSTLVGLYEASSEEAAIRKAAEAYVDRIGLGSRFLSDEDRLKEVLRVVGNTRATGVNGEPIEVLSTPSSYDDFN